MRFVLTLIVALACGPPAVQAQAASGTVTDAESGAPIPGANVLVAGSQIGDATDADGQYTLVTELSGTRTLVFSAVGFQTVTRSVLLPGAVLDIALAPETLSLGEALVEREEPRLWRQKLRRFEREFIGTSRNAGGVRILNPEVLALNESESGLFTAVSEATLQVENTSLGYHLTFYNLRFTSTGERWHWQGEVTFREMTGTDRQRRRWERARQKAYEGSWPHFAARMASGDAYEAGYRVIPTSRPGARLSINTLTLVEDQLQEAMRMESSPGSAVFQLSIPDAWQIRYLREEDPRPYTGQPRGGGQVSYLVLKGGAVRITPDGQVLDPLHVMRFGYWDSERVADMMPADYSLPSN